MSTRRPTLAKVAALAGVSVSQASDALRGGGRVSAATRDKVRSAAKQLGYQTQSVAKVLREGTTAFIAVVADREITHAPDGSIHAFWGKFLTSFTVTAREYGYAVILDFDGSTNDVRQLPAQAVLTLTSNASRIASLKGGGFGQVVALSPDADPSDLIEPGQSGVVLQHDYAAIGRDLAEFLADRGASRVQVIRRPGRHWYAAEIERGLVAAAPDHDLVVSGTDLADGDLVTAVRAAVPDDPDIDGIVDLTGVTAVLEAVAAERGRSVSPRAGAGSLVVVAQGEGTGIGIDPAVHYLSLLGAECGEIIAEHIVAMLYGRDLPPPLLPYRLIPAAGS